MYADGVMNRFMLSLSNDLRIDLLSRARKERLESNSLLYKEFQIPDSAYLPLDGVASVLAVSTEGDGVEVGLVGREGIVGAYHVLGPARVATRCNVQVGGNFLRLPFADFQRAYLDSEELRRRIHEFVQADSLSVSQIAGCNLLHDQRQRLARWLLMASDRHESSHLMITQDILAGMIGAKRPTVNMLCGVFRSEGFIEYQRGSIKIISRAGLERVACYCYQVAKSLFDGLYTN
jgi:CRP-like cAMP-binding protein